MVSRAGSCPPHHWLVEEGSEGLQRWACYRCGAERQQQQALPVDRPYVSWGPRAAGEEASVRE